MYDTMIKFIAQRNPEDLSTTSTIRDVPELFSRNSKL